MEQCVFSQLLPEAFKPFRNELLQGRCSIRWIGSGQNLPISTDQLNSVLHSDALNQVASKFGIDPNTLQSMMTQVLPHVVDKMTPNGQAAAAGQEF